MSALYISCTVSTEGKILTILRSSSSEAHKGYIPVEGAELASAIAMNPRAYTLVDGEWKSARRVYLTSLRPWMYADGGDVMALGVQGVTKHDGTVHVTLNGRHVNLRWNDTIEFVANEIGIWIFRLDDARFWAKPDAITITAIERTQA